MADDLGEKCGLFGVYHHPEAAKLTYLGPLCLAAPRSGELRHRVLRWEDTMPKSAWD